MSWTAQWSRFYIFLQRQRKSRFKAATNLKRFELWTCQILVMLKNHRFIILHRFLWCFACNSAYGSMWRDFTKLSLTNIKCAHACVRIESLCIEWAFNRPESCQRALVWVHETQSESTWWCYNGQHWLIYYIYNQPYYFILYFILTHGFVYLLIFDPLPVVAGQSIRLDTKGGLKTCILEKSRNLLSYDSGELKTIWPAKKRITGSSICSNRSGNCEEFGHESRRAEQNVRCCRDLAANWDIDIASSLEGYLEDLDTITIQLHDGNTNLNFAEAALLIQVHFCFDMQSDQRH